MAHNPVSLLYKSHKRLLKGSLIERSNNEQKEFQKMSAFLIPLKNDCYQVRKVLSNDYGALLVHVSSSVLYILYQKWEQEQLIL